MKNKISIRIALFILILMISTACQPQSEGKPASEKATISASGAFAIYPLMIRWAEEYQKLNPNIQIDISAGGAGKGMSDAIAGMVDIGMVSREVKPEEEKQGAFAIAVAKDAVFPTISAQNPNLQELLSKGINKEGFSKIYLSADAKTWGDALNNPEIKDTINVYTRSDACGAAEVWSKFVGGKAQEDLQGIGVSGDPGVVEAVKKDALGIGFNNLNYAFDANSGKPVQGIAIVPIDLNANGKADESEVIETKAAAIKAVADGTYPSPPARPLYLVSKGKPSGALGQFLSWILTDGQKYLDEVGYIPLPNDIINAEREKLK